MVAGWPHHREGMFHLSIQHAVHALDYSAGCGAGRPDREMRDVRGGVEVTTTGVTGSIEHRQVIRIVDAGDHRIRRRRRDFRGEAQVSYLDRVEDCDHALRTLGVAFGAMPDLLGVGEKGNHLRVRVRKRSSSNGAWRSM